MNAMLTINVRVVGRAAQSQLNQLAAATSAVVNAGATSNAKKTLGFFDALRGNKLLNAGKNLQWVGRQLTFNFTLPLVAAGAALTKFNLDVQRSMIEVKKVYGDMTFTQERVNEETTALAHSFELLSTAFGVHQKEVVDIAAAWASAGSAGRGLAENVQGTLEAMVLGELDAAKATEGLIAIQATWGLSTVRNADGVSELSSALATLNVIENQTGIRFEGLIDVLVRAGGVARTAGMTIQELAAMAAALVPATGSAVQAGNALKTIISRIQAPTKETIDILAKMGITVASEDWLGKTATQKIMDMATSFDSLSQANKTLVSSIIASRWQVNKFSVLMADIASGAGYFQKALEASNDEVRNNTQYQKELLTVLDSNPKKWDIMTNAIRNSMADALVPLIPIILQVLGLFTRLARWFASLPASTRTIILMGLALIALAGPLLTLQAMIMQLIALVQIFAGVLMALASRAIIPFISAVTTAAGAAITALAGLSAPVWIVIAVIAALAAAVILIMKTDIEEPIIRTLQGIVNAFGKLPSLIGRALIALLQVIQRIITAIVDWLSYLNPFARHSPSLVDQVRAGITTILDEYARLNSIPSVIAGALGAMAAFTTANKALIDSFRGAELMGLRNDVVAAGGDSASADAMVASIKELEASLPALTAQIADQTAVVADWSAQLATADAVLAEAQGRLDAAEKALEGVTSQMEAARDRISELANAPLTGMKAMEDQIFANEQAQNQLNLALLQYEKEGWTLDSIRDKYAAINGEIELLRGEQQDLRLSGAGSDVLSVYEDQITAIDAQRDSLGETEQAIIDINKQLDGLDLERRFLDLTKSITFDPLLRQIDQMVNSVAEMDFDDVVAGIQEQQALLAQLQPQYDALVASVEAEKAAVDAAKTSRDAISDQLDAEEEKLRQLQNAYTDIEALIRSMEDAMRGFAEASEAAKRAAKGGGGGAGDLFDAGAGADFPIAGGGDVLGPEGLLADIEAFNKELEDKLKDIFGKMTFDPLKPLRDAWEKVKAWATEAWDKLKGWFQDGWNSVVAWFQNIDWAQIGQYILIGLGAALLAVPAAFYALYEIIKGIGPKVWGWIQDEIIQPIVDGFSGAFDGVWEAIDNTLIQPIISGFKTLASGIATVWTTLTKPIVSFLGWMNTYVVPVFGAIIGLIAAILNRFYQWWKIQWDSLMWIVHLFLDNLGTMLAIAAVPFNLFITAIKLLFESIATTVDVALTFIGIAFEGLVALVQFHFAILKAIWDFIGQDIFNAMLGIVTTMATVLGDAIGIIIGLFDNLWQVLSGIFEQIKAVIETGLQVITDIIHVVTDLINGDWKKAWHDFAQIFKDIWTGIKKFVQGVVDEVKGILSGAWDSVKGTVRIAWELIKGLIINPLQAVLDWITELPGKFLDLVSDLYNAGLQLAKNIYNGIVDGLKGIFDAIVTPIKNAIKAVMHGVNVLIDGWNALEFKVPGFHIGPVGYDGFTLGLPDLGHVPENFHTGGVVPGLSGAEQLAVLQAGEIVFQPNQLAMFARGAGLVAQTANAAGDGGATTINIYGNLSFPNITDPDDAKEFIENLKAMVD